MSPLIVNSLLAFPQTIGVVLAYAILFGFGSIGMFKMLSAITHHKGIAIVGWMLALFAATILTVVLVDTTSTFPLTLLALFIGMMTGITVACMPASMSLMRRCEA